MRVPGEAFVRRCWSVYPEIEYFVDRVRFYQGAFALVEVLIGIENGASLLCLLRC